MNTQCNTQSGSLQPQAAVPPRTYVLRAPSSHALRARQPLTRPRSATVLGGTAACGCKLPENHPILISLGETLSNHIKNCTKDFRAENMVL